MTNPKAWAPTPGGLRSLAFPLFVCGAVFLAAALAIAIYVRYKR
jgi:hypothetical protein